MDAQPKLYIYAIGVHMKMVPKGVIINAIKKSKSLDRAEFAREVIMPTDFQLEECVEQTIKQADKIEALVESNVKADFVMHYGECVRYNRTCDYFDVCLGNVIDMDALFKHREPDYTEMEEEA